MGDPDHAPGPDPAPAVPQGGAPPVRRRRRTRLVVVGVVVLIAVAVGVAVAADEPDQVATTVAAARAEVPGAELEGSWATTTTSTTTTTTMPAAPAEDGLAIAPPLPRPWPDSFLVADATGPGVPLFSKPGVAVPSGRVMENPSWEGLALSFLVRERTTEWLHVQLMSRPNSALAWIKRSDVTLRRVQNHIVIEREARRITVFHGEEQIYQASVATGKAESPTPLGTFFVDGVIRLSPPHKAYGTGQLSFTGFSEVYESFGGGIGQVAMHGTQNPALIGTPASHGCVRMRNEDIEKLYPMVP
ncbi:MAG TPA: L,D-transpeptidase, partial [Iamia sp.]|nr:L,D-transpeptidase [Iamia sp.]